MSFLDGRALRDWCREKFQLKDDILRTTEAVTENTEEGKSVDALVIKEVFQSVSDGKLLIASAITDKGILTDAGNSFAVMAENIRQIETGSGSSGSGNYPIASPYLFELNWQFAVGSAGAMDLKIPFPVKRLKKFIVKKLYFYVQRVTTGNSIWTGFYICGTKKGETSATTIKYYVASVNSTGSSASNVTNISDLEFDLSEWESVDYCQLYKSGSSGTFNYANATLNFQVELYY